MAKIAGIKLKKEKTPKVSVISIIDNQYQLQNVLESFSRQTYENKELIFIILNKEFAKTARKYIYEDRCFNSNIFKMFTEKQVNKCNNIMDICKSDYISHFSFDNYYAKNFLIDLVNSRKYSDSKVTGKNSYFVFNKNKQNVEVVNSDNEYSYTTQIETTASIIETGLLKEVRMKNIYLQLKNKENLEKLFESEVKFFSTDKYNFIKGYNTCYEDIRVNENIISQISV